MIAELLFSWIYVLRFKWSFMKYCLRVIVCKWQLPEFENSKKTSAKRFKSQLQHERDALLFNLGCGGGHWNNTADLLVLRRLFHYYVRALLAGEPPLSNTLTQSSICLRFLVYFYPLLFAPILQNFLELLNATA